MKTYNALIVLAALLAFHTRADAQSDQYWTGFEAVDGSVYEMALGGIPQLPDRVNRLHSIVSDETITARFAGTPSPGWGGTFSVGVDVIQSPGVPDTAFASNHNALSLRHVYRGIDTVTEEFSYMYGSYNLLTNTIGSVLNTGYFTFNHSETPGSPNESHLTFDFTGLENGVLPSGTILFFADVDIAGVENPILTAAVGSPLAWVDYLGFFQQNTTFPGETSSIIIPDPLTTDSLSYAFDTYGPDNNFAINAFITTADITGLTVYNPPGEGSGSYQFGILAPTPIPEPSGALLLGFTGLAALLRRGRAHKA